MASPCDDEESFEEDGCTMDFFDDPSPGAMVTTTVGPVVYRHYDGEDFSQYLNDDDHDDRQRNHWGVAAVEPDGPCGLPADDRSANTRRRLSTANIREKLGRLLLTNGSGRSRNSTLTQQQNLNRNCGDVSFADCKMGGSVDYRSPSEGGSVLGSDSGIDCRSAFSLETESDLGVQATSGWWDMDSSLSPSNRPSRSSASAIDLPRSVVDNSSNRPNGRLDRRPEVRSVGGGNEAVASREPAQRPSSDPDRTDGANKRLTNTFRKFYNTLSRRKAPNLQQMSYVQNSEDSRL